MSEVESRFVKRGLWTNLDHGPVMGKTITVDTSTGTIVIALLAVLSTLGTAHLWHLLVFFCHQIRANGMPGDALFRQQQAILRTLPPPSTLLADSLKLWWEWRQKSDSVLARTLFLAILGLFCALSSLAASISSSYVVDTTNLEVLVSSPWCGRLNRSDIASNSYVVHVNDISETFVRDCYQYATSLPGRCKIFKRPNIPFSTEPAACPFAAGICKGKTNEKLAVAVDSGLLDMNDAFGLNLNKKDRVKYRRKTTCSVLSMGDHSSIVNASDFPIDAFGRTEFFDNEQLVLYHWGTREVLGEWKNVTFAQSLLEANFTQKYGIASVMAYAVNKEDGYNGGYEPLPELYRDDADIAIINIGSNSVMYRKPVEDPIFSAHKRIIKSPFGVSGTNKTFYMADTTNSGMGCAAQYQFCAANSTSEFDCSPLSGLQSNITTRFGKASGVQKAALQLLFDISLAYDVSSLRTLNASSALNSGSVAATLPDNQWVVEVQTWEKKIWAAFQTAITDYAIGPQTRDHDVKAMPLADASEEQLCHLQKMRKNGGFVNINFFGLVFIVTVSVFFTVVDISLLKFLIFMSKFRRALAPRIDRWIQDGVLQLQRRAYEAQGQGTWINLEQDIPLTVEKYQFTDLPTASLEIVYAERPAERPLTQKTWTWSSKNLTKTFTWSTKSVKSNEK